MFSVYYVTGIVTMSQALLAIQNILQNSNIFDISRETVLFMPFGDNKSDTVFRFSTRFSELSLEPGDPTRKIDQSDSFLSTNVKKSQKTNKTTCIPFQKLAE